MIAKARRWSVDYYGSWVVALGAVAGIGAPIVCLVLPERRDGSGAFLMIGAGTGALLGAWIAHRTRHSRGTHRALRWGGGGLFLFGLVGAVVMFVGPEQGRGSLATIEECALGMGGVVLAVIGVFFWLAGFSGSRLGGSAAPTNSLPLA